MTKSLVGKVLPTLLQYKYVIFFQDRLKLTKLHLRSQITRLFWQTYNGRSLFPIEALLIFIKIVHNSF